MCSSISHVVKGDDGKTKSHISSSTTTTKLLMIDPPSLIIHKSFSYSGNPSGKPCFVLLLFCSVLLSLIRRDMCIMIFRNAPSLSDTSRSRRLLCRRRRGWCMCPGMRWVWLVRVFSHFFFKKKTKNNCCVPTLAAASPLPAPDLFESCQPALSRFRSKKTTTTTTTTPLLYTREGKTKDKTWETAYIYIYMYLSLSLPRGRNEEKESKKKTHRRDPLRQLHILGHSLDSIQRTLLIHILHLLTQILCLMNQADESVFDRQVQVCAVHDFGGEVSFGFDGEDFAAV